MSLGLSSAPDFPITGDPRSLDRAPFEIGDWRVEPERWRLLRGSEIRKLEPMAMRLLVFLAERPAEVISRAEILNEVWEGRAVVDETLSRAMSLLRQALGDNPQEPAYIETLPRRGYRLIAPVRRAASASREPSPVTTPGASHFDGILRTVSNRRRILVGLMVLVTVMTVWLALRGRERPALIDAPTMTDAASTDAVSTGAAESSRRPGIAVLPFKNLSPDPANAYIATGLTEELIHQLAGVSGLRVVSRASSMSFRDSDASAPEIAQALNVDYLLEGTVLAIDQRLRITAQLIRPDVDEHLLSRSYDRDFSEVLDLQREVAKDVVERTRIELSPTEALRLTRDDPISAEAYRTYLQGRQIIQQRSELDRGLDLLTRAVELDPRFAPAWAALADVHLLSNSYLGRPDAAAYTSAEAAIDRALDLDPELAAAHASLGLLRLQRDRDWSGAEAAYRRALELERSYVTARQWYSELLSLVGRHEAALYQIGIALELDPLSPLIHAVAGQRLHAASRYREALRRFQDAEALGADFRWNLREKAWLLQRLGRDSEALEILVDLAIHRGRGPSDQRIVELRRLTQEHGLKGYNTWDLQRLLATDERRPGYSTWVTAAYAGTGQTEEAFIWLAKAVQERNMWLVHTLKSPAFDSLRDDPRFAEILEDIPPWRPL